MKMLHGETSIKSVKEAFCKYPSAEVISWGENWELFKQDCKLNAIERATVLSRKEKETESNQKRNFREKLRLECEAPGAFWDDIRAIKNKIEAIDRQKYRGATLRARTERHLEGEVPTERAVSDGELTRDKKVIEDAFVQHYTTHFSPAVPNIEDFNQDFLRFMPRLSDDFKNTLEGTITLGEVERPIGILK